MNFEFNGSNTQMTKSKEQTFPNHLVIFMQQTKRYRARGGCSRLAADTRLSA